jgi:hypothetical protein
VNGCRMQQVSDAVGFRLRRYFTLALGHEI